MSLPGVRKRLLQSDSLLSSSSAIKRHALRTGEQWKEKYRLLGLIETKYNASWGTGKPTQAKTAHLTWYCYGYPFRRQQNINFSFKPWYFSLQTFAYQKHNAISAEPVIQPLELVNPKHVFLKRLCSPATYCNLLCTRWCILRTCLSTNDIKTLKWLFLTWSLHELGSRLHS